MVKFLKWDLKIVSSVNVLSPVTRQKQSNTNILLFKFSLKSKSKIQGQLVEGLGELFEILVQLIHVF